MGTQHEVTRKQPLLNANGRIGEPGWAKQLVWNYNRDWIGQSIPKPLWNRCQEESTG